MQDDRVLFRGVYSNIKARSIQILMKSPTEIYMVKYQGQRWLESYKANSLEAMEEKLHFWALDTYHSRTPAAKVIVV
ncbi:MAG: hypothetical protein EBV84_06525, partial [Betaproteobacteria bacterium]|nr:hypothetical protein [Betaproteobacteria bacterium]